MAGIHEFHIKELAKKNVSTSSKLSLSAQFYHFPEIYELERRAIFSRQWILISHSARYKTTGDFAQYEMAGFNFVVLKNKTGEIVAFHNVCRHRAFPLVTKQSGHTFVLSCKYHGWTYNLGGQLVKAPRFTPDSLAGFETSQINLFSIHTHVDRNGFVYVNLDASEEPTVSWEDQYGNMDQQKVLVESGIDWTKVEYDFTWTAEGNFNWKLMQDNYNECYHCLTAHPAVAKTTNLDTYFVIPSPETTAYISHFNEPKATTLSEFDETRFHGRSATHVFPIGHFSPNPGTGFMHLMRSMPTSPTTTRQEYDVYKLHTLAATPDLHASMTKFYKQVTAEDVELCNLAQQNLQRGIYTSGLLHPFHEEGVMAFQDTVRRVLNEHVECEEQAGRKISPAERELGAGSGSGGIESTILSCALLQSKDLSW
ncbi:Rieske [2Fe-2S] domain protein [Leptodontidium sp. MPI-SDFR-AT-0119]|nr:Rieske [2Fe-2S] domain protein [Leptodontidium sp. MPI-SDFR-AT-0119]